MSAPRRWFEQPEVVAAHRERIEAPEPEPAAPVDFSGPIDVVNFLLVRVGVPGKHRAYIDAVLGAAENRTDWFEADDRSIGSRIRGEDAERISLASVRKAAQRGRDEFNAWQQTAGVTLVETMPGGREGWGKRYPSRYRLPVLELAQQVYASARQHPLWRTRPERAVSVEAKAALSQLRSAPARRERFRRLRDVTARHLAARAARAIVKALDLAAKRCEVAEDVMREFVGGLTDEGRAALAEVMASTGVEQVDGSTCRIEEDKDRTTTEPTVNVLEVPPAAVPEEMVDSHMVDESVHLTSNDDGHLRSAPLVEHGSTKPEDHSGAVTEQSADEFDDLAAGAEEEFGPYEDAPGGEDLAPVDPDVPVLVADTSGACVQFDVIPLELQALKHWAVFRRVPNQKGKLVKIPYRPAKPTWKASSVDPKTWSTIDAARAVYEDERNGFDGVYFTLTEALNLVGVDLDHCVDEETGAIEPWALAVVHRLQSYTEVSPSRTGLRILMKGTKPGARCKSGHKEMYVKTRFLSVTGWHLAGTPTTLEERTAEVAEVYREWFPREEPARPSIPIAPTLLADTEVLEIGARICPGFSALWQGSTAGYPSHSEARFALFGRLAFLTGGDEAQMARLFRMSGLMTDKCETKRLGVVLVEWEAQRAVNKATKFYEPRAQQRANR